MKNILLTISILISNRPDTVEKCLKSLNNLRKTVPSELILVDTGCGEQVRKIIESYADKIINFEWCNDFAKARNVGLAESSGQWFLYMDDDEWFENTDALEHFFLSEDYERYSSAYYTVRNYLDKNGNTYTDSLLPRMTKIYPDTKFIYSIHECIGNIRRPCAKIDSYVHHYGYVYDTAKEKYLHTQRNVQLLLKEYEKDTNNARTATQLAQEYVAIREYIKSIDISLSAIERCHACGRGMDWIPSLQANIVRNYYQCCDYQQAIHCGEEYLRDPQNNALGKVAIYSVLCKANFELHFYDNCLKYLQEYLKANDKRLENKNYYIEYETLFLDCFGNTEVYSDIGFGIRAAIATGNSKKAKKIFERIEWNAEKVFVDYETLVDIVNVYIETDKNDEYLDMVNTLLKNEKLVKTVIEIIENKRKENPKLLRDTDDKWKKVYTNHWYFKYLRVWSGQTQQEEDYIRLWDSPQYALARSIDLELWNIADKNGIDIEKVLKEIPFYKWKEPAKAVCETMKWSNLQTINVRIELMDSNNENVLWWKLNYLQRTFSEIDIRTEYVKININDLRELLKKYVAICKELFGRLYRKELLEEKSPLLPLECQIMFLLNDLFMYEEKKDFSSMVKNLKNLQELCSDFAPLVKYFLIYTEEMIDFQRVEQKKAANELQTMAYIMKGKIEELIGMGRYQEAYSITQQVRRLVPDNLEIKELEKMLKVSLKVELAD